MKKDITELFCFVDDFVESIQREINSRYSRDWRHEAKQLKDGSMDLNFMSSLMKREILYELN